MPKTLAIKMSDELHAQAAAVAQLEGTSLTEFIRQSIERQLEAKRDSGELQDRAQAVLDDIERDAKVRREAIAGLLNGGGELPGPSGLGRFTPHEWFAAHIYHSRYKSYYTAHCFTI